ncbi:MAG: C-terminal binding protein [Planctomycetota bacterium]|nr:MAG: C-terminal binding protein [Planctomycetota bacterium]
MSKFLVCITDYIHEPLDIERQVLGDIAEVQAVGATSNAELVGRVEQADALMVYHFVSIDRELMRRMPRLKVVARCGAGFDNIDVAFAREQGIAVTNVPDYGTEDVADAALAMALSLARGTHRMAHICQRGTDNWSYELAVPLRRIRGQVFGIIGLGRIGTATALRAKAFGYDVVFLDPHVGDGMDKALGIRRAADLEELLRQCHVVSCHCLLSEQTRHLINPQTIQWLPPGSILINTARGAVVDAMAVLQGLESGRLLGAGIDVLEQEPPDPEHPLIRAWRDPNHPAFERLILTPHAAFYTEEGLADMRRKGSQNVRQVLLGQPCRNIVN